MTENGQKPEYNLEYEDMQGLIMRGYSGLPSAYFVLLKIREGGEQAAKAWLKSILPEVTNAVSKDERTEAVHLAFTREGLRRFGLGGQTQFACEFEDGMTIRYKQRTLGDHGESAPENWQWGGTKNPEIDILLMLYADDDEGHTERLDALYARHEARFDAGGLELIKKLDTRTLVDRKEHFCFTDGFSQPVLDGTRLARAMPDSFDVLAPGEFVLGYHNAYDKYPDSPSIPPTLDPHGRLKTIPEEALRDEDDRNNPPRDFGRNGTYMVFRTLEQDVFKFWKFLHNSAEGNAVERDRLAAKMVGRWRSGVSLIQSPDADDEGMEPANDFMYCAEYMGRAGDPTGAVCPIGSHARRSNPRDTVFPGSEDLVTDSNKHRILRRGRSYGEPPSAMMDPDEIVAREPDDVERGLHFVCMNSDIGRQFEFVQHTWINNPRFANMYNELDPLVGDYGKRHRLEGNNGDFSMPGDPVRQRITGLTRFVYTRGGAYFFMPGISALHVMADLP